MTTNPSFKSFRVSAMALDPIHVGTGGTRLGRVDNTIVRDPVTRIPKIPGSSLAGVLRAYVAMSLDKYPRCAGQGQTASDDGQTGHCCNKEGLCKVCTVFGYATGYAGTAGGFAGLAAFSDMHPLLFPVSSRLGPQWITCPMALRQIGMDNIKLEDDNAVYRNMDDGNNDLNLGWLLLPVKSDWPHLVPLTDKLNELKISESIQSNLGVVSDKLFAHIVNSNLETRTSVSINPATGAAEDGALFTYEAIPRATILTWTLTCRNPKDFKSATAVDSPDAVKDVVQGADTYLKHLGIGGMGSRGMGRMQVLSYTDDRDSAIAGEGA